MGMERAQRIDALRRKQRTQVLVIGGGINGISTFRELVLNGVDAVLVERDDFMSGASAAPSRMIHGGLRYLENGEFALVRESLRERNLLLANAPHLVSPLPTLIPITSRFSGIWSAARRFLGANVAPGERGTLIIRLGLALYDLYAGGASGLPRHRFFGKAATRRLWPDLRGDLIGTAIYHDAKISHPERLGVEMILECDGLDNALALNHVAHVSFSDPGALLADRLTGEAIRLDADIVVNATGAWIDLTNDTLARTAPQLIGGTKGSHVVIDNARLKKALGDGMVYFANRDGRVCILFVHLGNVLAGSTDISVGSPDAVRCEAEEVDYIRASIAEVFPGIVVADDEIIYRFAGVRPLPSGTVGVNANISRDHSCEWLAAGTGARRPILNLVGGKWTTFRAFGEEAADKVMARLGVQRRLGTADRPIGGGRGYPRAEARSAWLSAPATIDPAYLEQLLHRYGTRAAELARRIGAAAPDFLASMPSYSRQEITWLVETEHVATLEDVLLRRMTVAFSGELSLDAVEEVGGIAASALKWDEAQQNLQIETLLGRLERFHGLSRNVLRRRNPDRKEDDVRRRQSAHEPPVQGRQVS